MNNINLLEGILHTLVLRFGKDRVIETINRISDDTDKKAATGRQKHRKHRKAADIVAASDQINDHRKLEIISSLAKDFDEGRFLPSTADVRAFLELHHKGGKEARGRIHAFPLVLSALSQCTLADLWVIKQNEASGGITELGPLADAIRAAGEALRGKSETSTTKNEKGKEKTPPPSDS